MSFLKESMRIMSHQLDKSINRKYKKYPNRNYRVEKHNWNGNSLEELNMIWAHKIKNKKKQDLTKDEMLAILICDEIEVSKNLQIWRIIFQ